MKAELAVSIDLGGTFIKYGLVNLDGEILWQSKVVTPAESRELVLDQLVKCVDEARSIQDPQCIGVGTPGLVDFKKGVVINGAPQLDRWNDLALSDKISERTGLPVYVDNDANLMGLGEYRFGNNSKLENLVFLTIGTGIGGAIIMNGDLCRGGFFAGGEFGLIPYDRPGKSGFWEEFGSTKAMVNHYCELKELTKDEDINGKLIFEQAGDGDIDALSAIEEHVDILGFGIAGLLSSLNPEKVIIGGGISESGKSYIKSINERVIKYAAPECYAGVEIEAAVLGNKAGFLGAGYYALSSHLNKK